MVTTLAGTKGYASLTDPGDGKGTLARFMQPVGIAVNAQGTAFVADAFHNTLRMVLGDGTTTTLAGKVNTYSAVDGVGAAARFGAILGVAIDQAGIVYAGDYSAVRRIDPATGAVTTLAGKLGPFSSGTADGDGAAARFGYLSGIAVDRSGNVYVADSLNHNVRKITPNGTVTTLAGSAGVIGSADGQGQAASFNRPQGIAVDGAGNVYIADTDNHLIRQITPSGLVSTIAGRRGANGNVPGDLRNALSHPIGLAFDANGILYVTASNGIFQLYL